MASRIEREDLIAPELLDAEILAVLRRAVLTAGLTVERAQMAITDLVQWDLRRLAHRYLVHEAWDFRHNASAYDALYLAAARLHDAPLLTADGPLARAPSAGIVVESVRT